MNDFLLQVEQFLNAQALPELKDKAAQGTAAIRKWLDMVDAQVAGLKFACGPDDAKKCAALAAKCCELCPECDPKHPKGFGLPGLPGLTLLFQVLQMVLAELAKPAAPTTPTA